MTTHLITVPAIGESPQIAINPEGEKLKLQLLHSREIVAVTDDQSRNTAIAAAGLIKAHIKEFQDQWEKEKKPFWDMCKKLDALKSSYLATLDAELKRLNNLNGAYEAEKQRQARIAGQQRAAEEARLAREKMAAEREAARIAEEVQKKEWAAAAKGKELTDAQKAKQMEAQLDAAEKLEKYEADQERLMRERNEEQARLLEAKPTGGSLKHEIDITVLDLQKLYAHNHAFVRMEAELNSIKFFIRTEEAKGNTPVIPGISYSNRAVFSARGSR